MREAAQNAAQNPRNVYATAVNGCSDEVATHLPQQAHVLRAIRQMRNRRDGIRALPNNLQQLQLPPDLCQTKSGQNFLLHDSGPGNDRILIFGTEAALDALGENGDWFMDGTFKTAPPLFEQLYTIHGVRQHAVLPCVFALLPGKSQQLYRRLLQALRALRNDFNPTSILTDFELAAMNSVRAVFPRAVIRGCYYHFQQALWRHIQQDNVLLNRLAYFICFMSSFFIMLSLKNYNPLFFP